MRLFLILIFSLYCAMPPLSAQGNGIEQASELVTVGPDKFLRWYGHAGRTYFIQVSDPNDHLKRWTWAPIIESGNNADISYEVDGTADNGFFRLKYTDQPTTDPDNDDFDGDTISNIDEVSFWNSDPLDADTDNDGMPDGYEADYYFDLNFDDGGYDYDSDGLTNLAEYTAGTEPNYADTDGDKMPDGFEVLHMLNPLNGADATTDADGDGLGNLWEFKLDLNPRLTDSNTNGVSDAFEDRELDGLANLAELITHNTDPSQPDTDMDTLPDGWELANGFNPIVHNGTDADPANDAGADPDGDGLTNSQEADYNTKANDPDSDGDGVDDGVEAGQGSNPNDPNDSQPPPNGTVPVNVTFGDDSGSHSEKYRVTLTPLEGDAGGVRFRSNREYGTPQTDTFRLPKGAKYKVELVHIGTKPDFKEENGFSNYDWTLDIDTSANGLVIDDPQTIVTTVVDWPNSTFQAEGKSATLYVPLFKPKEVSFAASTIGNLTSDDTSVTYDAPHWQDGNDDGDADDPGERKYPIAYVRNTPPTIEGIIKVNPSGLTSVPGFSAKIKVTGPGNINIGETATTLGTDEIKLRASTGNFVKHIDYLNPMTLSWEVMVNDKGHWCKAGQTANRTYVTLGVPTTALRQETLFYIGCRNADDESVAASAVDKIYLEFSDQSVQRVDRSTGLPDGIDMTYWSPTNPAPQPQCWKTEGLLALGDGRCEAWARFMNDCLAVHAIASDVARVNAPAIVSPAQLQSDINTHLPPDTYHFMPIFFVKNWDLSNANPFNPIDLQNGLAGQGRNPDPKAEFNDHVILIFNGEYYDPSYGSPKATTKAAWEDQSLDGFGAYVVGQNSETLHKWKERLDPKGTLETTIKKITP
jgi:hypothetical protein